MLTDNVIRNFLHGSKATLETLDLQGNTFISDQGLLTETAMKNLKALHLRECFGLTSNGLTTLLLQSTLLEHVDLSHLGTINDDVFQQLAKCQNLQTLDLSYANLAVSDETFKYFIDQHVLTLKRLALDFTNISKELLCYSLMKLKRDAI